MLILIKSVVTFIMQLNVLDMGNVSNATDHC